MTSFDIIASIASILGLVASIAGLIVSVAAWRQAKSASTEAKSASTAAKEARDGIVLRTLADEFELACVKIDQLLDFILHDRLPEAAMRAQELTSALSEIPYRRSPYLSEERKNDLLDAREQVRIINQVIAATRDQPPAIERKQKLVRQCQKISMTLRKNLGTIKGEMDTGANQ